MTADTTDAEVIARIIADTNQPGHWDASGRAEKERRLNEANAILSYLASRREAQEPVAWRYRWKIDGEWVSWRVSERSQASEHLLPSLEEYPLYLAPPAPAGEVERLRGALNEIDALDPEEHTAGCSTDALRGLVLRMGKIARAALHGGRHD